MAEGPPTRDFIGPYGGCGLHPNGPGARKEKARVRAYARPPAVVRKARAYAELRVEAARAVSAWRDDVRRGRFPGPAEIYN